MMFTLAGMFALLAATADAADFGHRYMAFLDAAKTPRLLVRQVAREAAGRGFRTADVFSEPVTTKPGDRLMFVSRERSIALVIIGREPLANGFRLVGTHVDTPKFRVVQRPIVITDGRVALRTVFHGGIKEYQWLTRPLALMGTVNRRDGKEVDVALGLNDDEAFAMATWASAPVRGGAGRKDPWAGWAREYDVVVAGFPKGGPSAVDPKAAFLKFLDARFGVTEGDLDSSELYFVPVQTARWVGVGKRLIGGFGQDDKVCSYAAARAAIDFDVVPDKTAIAILTDREEIGSTGPSGAASEWLDALIAHLIAASRIQSTRTPVTEREIRAAFSRAEVLSSDVTAGVNPLFPQVHELKNAARLGRGPAMIKWTGRHGKQGGSDAHAEFVHRVARIFGEAGVPLQVGNIGRVDEGGGGTIAKFLANKGANVLDLGVPMISMHAAFDVTHRSDIENLARGVRAFFVAK